MLYSQVMTASTASKLKKECGSLSRALQLQQASIQSTPMPTSALPYDQCCEALNQQQEIVCKYTLTLNLTLTYENLIHNVIFTCYLFISQTN